MNKIELKLFSRARRTIEVMREHCSNDIDATVQLPLQELLNQIRDIESQYLNEGEEWKKCKCKGGATGRRVTEDFEHQICDTCGGLFG